MKREIEFLLNQACPSIRYRVKKEVLSQLSPRESAELKQLILTDDLVIKYLSLQRPDGWIDADIHSQQGVEAAVRVLAEKGLDANDPVVFNMLDQLEKRTDSFDHGCLARVGKILDKLGLGGSQLIKAVIFAYAGSAPDGLVNEQVKVALAAFQSVHNAKLIDDVVTVYKNKLVFKPGVKWPGIYHLRLLAYSKNWRNPENLKLLIKSIKQLVLLSPIPDISGLFKSQMVAPGSFCMHDFNVDLFELDGKGWMMWLHRMELLARIGVVRCIPVLNAQLKVLKHMVNEKSGVFAKRYNHYYFTKWGVYTGLALERDWRTKKRYLCDILFRSLLIIYYADRTR